MRIIGSLHAESPTALSPNIVSQKSELRNDIQGIRAIGCLLVFVFHVFANGVSGGVDVFFVVSGYFMARNAAKRNGIGGATDILGFYKNFLLRIAPQAALTLVGITAIVYFFSSPMSWAANLRDVAASALYIENWWLIQRGQDYLARSEALSFTQHFWAISLIGQSYFVWPLLLNLSNFVSRKAKLDPSGTLVRLVLLLSVASLLWSVYSTAKAPASAYFDFLARFWEFGAGVLLGLLNRDDSGPGSKASWLSWAGAALLLSCGFVIGTRLDFPGYASIWPVTAAILIIRYGRPADKRNASRFLAHPLLVHLGGISFGIYLWHWPLYALYEESAYRSYGNHLLAGLGILAASAGLAMLTKYVAERLLRRLSAVRNKSLVPLGILCMLLTVCVTTELARRHILKNGNAWNVDYAAQAGFIAPGPFVVRSDNAEVYQSGCHQDVKSEQVKTCTFGNGAAGKKIVLVGGSHSAQWLPALTSHADTEKWHVISMTKSGCLFADPKDNTLFEDLDQSCKKWNIQALEKIIELKPDLVVSIATRWGDKDGARTEEIPEGYHARFKSLHAADIRVLAIRDNPWMEKDMPRCVYSPVVLDKQVCGKKRAEVLNDSSFQHGLRHMPVNVRISDMTNHFCDKQHCWAVKDGISIYRDSHHITTTYAKKISKTLRDHIRKAW